ncbi:MAG: hypothetical protein WC755_06640 [Candidatus Woesearchaeota archaeon]|jgi:hypothetical protein
MEQFVEYLLVSKQKIYLAEKLLNETYPLADEPKLFFGVMQNTYFGIKYALLSLFCFEKYFDRVPKVDSMEEMTHILFKESSKRYPALKKIEKDYLVCEHLLSKHKDSMITFSKKENIMMYDDNYNLSKFGLIEVRAFLENAKLFYKEISKVLDLPVDAK